MRKCIALTDTQIRMIRMAVDHVTEFGEDTGQSGQQRAGELRTANGIAASLRRPVPVSPLLSAAKEAANFLHWFENEWNTMTDEEHGKWPGLVPLRKLRKAIKQIEGR